MLATLRKSANSFVIKLLMVILLFSFVLWGVGDMLRSGGNTSVLKIADLKVNEAEFNNLYQEQIAIIKQQFSHEFTKEELNDNQFKALITNQIVNRLLQRQIAADMNFMVSDDMVKFEIAGMPMFVKDGKFNKDLLDGYLRNAEMSESRFIELLKEDISSQNLGLLMAVLRFNSTVLTDTLMKAAAQTRIIKMVTLSKNIDINDVKGSDKELAEVFESNKAKFTVPERRDISYVVFGGDSIEKEVITDTLLMDIYKAKKQQFAEPEKRKVRQLVFKDKSQAEIALADINKGMSFDEVGKKNFPDKNSFLIGDITKQGLSINIANAIFALPEGVPSATLVESPLGHHIFVVDAIIPEKVRSFDEIKEQVKSAYTEERRYEKLNELAQKVDKEVLGGKALKEIAKDFGFKVQHIESVNKTDDKGMIKYQNFKTAAFGKDEGTVSMVMPIEGQENYFILSVDKVHHSVVKDMSEVKEAVIKIWQEDKAQVRLNDISQNLYKTLSGGADLNEMITKFGLNEPKIINLSMISDDAKKVPFEFLKEVFSIKEGGYTHPFKDDKGGYIIGYISEIKDADLEQLKDKSEYISQEMKQTIPNDMMSQILSRARDKYKVEINHKYIEGLDTP